MKTIGKIAIGAIVAIAGAVAVKKVTEKKFSTIKTNKHPETKETVDDIPTSKAGKWTKKIKEAATDKTLKILEWCGEHPKETIGLGAAFYVVVELVGAVTTFKTIRGVNKTWIKGADDLSWIKDELSAIKNSTWQHGFDYGWDKSTEDMVKCMREAMKAGQPFRISTADGSNLIKFNIMEVA